jgi:hypothetical protein
LDILSDDSCTAFPALWSSTFGALRLAVDAPRITILLNVRHAMFEWVTTFGTEEVTVMPVSSKSDYVFTENRGLTVLATRREQLMPIEVTKEP